MNLPVPRALAGRVRASAIPRALVRSAGVRAEESAGTMVGKLAASFEEFKAKHIGRIDALEASMDDQARIEAAAKLGGGGIGPTFGAVEPEYTRTFASYTRRGASDAELTLKGANATGDRGALQASMSVGDNSAGGYLAPVEWDRQIQVALRALSPFRRIAQVQTTSVGAYSTVWSSDQWGSGWVGETANRPQTTQPVLSPLVFPTGEIYAMPTATQRLLDDAAVDIQQWLTAGANAEFLRQEGIAFVSGDGLNKPAGFLTYTDGGTNAGRHPGGNLDVVASGLASDISPDALQSFKYGLAAPYRQLATWLMSSQTASYIAKMKDGQGRFIWTEGLADAQSATLLGRPVEIDENMPNPVAGAMAVAFGDFSRGYVINDRIGTRVLRDPYTAKPYVVFYMTKRVGGGVLDPRAIRVLKVATA